MILLLSSGSTLIRKLLVVAQSNDSTIQQWQPTRQCRQTPSTKCQIRPIGYHDFELCLQSDMQLSPPQLQVLQLLQYVLRLWCDYSLESQVSYYPSQLSPIPLYQRLTMIKYSKPLKFLLGLPIKHIVVIWRLENNFLWAL